MLRKGLVAEMWRYLPQLRLLGIRLGPRQHKAMQYLERKGYRFLVHFGYANAIDLARSVRQGRKLA